MTSPNNRLLASLPEADEARISRQLKSVRMPPSARPFQKKGQRIRAVYFPCGGAVSVVKTLANGDAIQVAAIGIDGAVGAGVFFGERVAECDAIVQLPGPRAMAMSAEAFTSEMRARGALFNRMVRYTQALASEMKQSITCRTQHTTKRRCCRWLLTAHDRAGGDEFRVTEAFVAAMLGVGRSTIELIVNDLCTEGTIRHRRGTFTIVDRSGLELGSCGCYRADRSRMARLLPGIGVSA